MPRRSLKIEQIIGKLCEVEVLVSKGDTIALACKKVSVSEQTYYRRSKSFPEAGKNGLTRNTKRDTTSDEVKCLSEESTDLKRAAAELILDSILLIPVHPA